MQSVQSPQKYDAVQLSTWKVLSRFDQSTIWPQVRWPLALSLLWNAVLLSLRVTLLPAVLSDLPHNFTPSVTLTASLTFFLLAFYTNIAYTRFWELWRTTRLLRVTATTTMRSIVALTRDCALHTVMSLSHDGENEWAALLGDEETEVSVSIDELQSSPADEKEPETPLLFEVAGGETPVVQEGSDDGDEDTHFHACCARLLNLTLHTIFLSLSEVCDSEVFTHVVSMRLASPAEARAIVRIPSDCRYLLPLNWLAELLARVGPQLSWHQDHYGIRTVSTSATSGFASAAQTLSDHRDLPIPFAYFHVLTVLVVTHAILVVPVFVAESPLFSFFLTALFVTATFGLRAMSATFVNPHSSGSAGVLINVVKFLADTGVQVDAVSDSSARLNAVWCPESSDTYNVQQTLTPEEFLQCLRQEDAFELTGRTPSPSKKRQGMEQLRRRLARQPRLWRCFKPGEKYHQPHTCSTD
ncbi:MAG: hypothetical protein MHM6MM_002333 [Cercozoa sp. M6MM]